MIELTNATGSIVSFDGRVLELLGRDCTRMHIRQVKKVEVKEKKGNYSLQVMSHLGAMMMVVKIDQTQKPHLDQLLGALNAARPGEIEFKS